MNFEWDENKNKINIKKHNIDFENAVKYREDKNNIDLFDKKNFTTDEQRWLKFGRIQNGKILCVVYTEISKNLVRIISAFSDKKIERLYYEQKN